MSPGEIDRILDKLSETERAFAKLEERVNNLLTVLKYITILVLVPMITGTAGALYYIKTQVHDVSYELHQHLEPENGRARSNN